MNVALLKEDKLREFLDGSPDLAHQLYAARGPCLAFQGRHPTNPRKTKCKKGDKCRCLRFRPTETAADATNKYHAPFVHLNPTKDYLRIDPPLRQALQYWWHTLRQDTDCPITDATVLRNGATQVVHVALNKALPRSDIQDSDGASWKRIEGMPDDNCIIQKSDIQIPEGRTWWHRAPIGTFGKIVQDSLTAGSEGMYKAVYSVEHYETCAGGYVYYAFESWGMRTKLTTDCSTPKVIPQGVIGYFDSAKGRQWLHHPDNIKLRSAYIEYPAACGKSRHRVSRQFFSERARRSYHATWGSRDRGFRLSSGTFCSPSSNS